MISIKVDRLSKVFMLNTGKRVTLKEKIIFGNRTPADEYWALKNVNCEIEQGKTVGIIGRNGSGKSTLLKMMTKIMYPTEGQITTQGKVSSLLELGAGFHPDFSGRENIYMNASILGFTKREIDGMVDDIIAFSELEDFIDNPLRSYSSGMYMRLAFSVAITVDPDILLIDEILSVGDTAFQRKCINRLKELKKRNKTIVIVSHDNNTLESMCDEIIWLKFGEVYKIGKTKEIIREYLDYMEQEDGKRHNAERLIQEEARAQAEAIQDEGGVEAPIIVEAEKVNTEKRWGNGKIRISAVKAYDLSDKETYTFQSGDGLRLEIHYQMNEDVSDVVFGFMITTMDGITCYGSNTDIDDYSLMLKKKGVIHCRISQLPLVAGTYLLDFAFHQVDGTAYDYFTGAASIHISSPLHDTGIVKIPHQWSQN